MGGREQVDKQHAKGKMTARERASAFFDHGSFREIDAFAKHRSTSFDLDKLSIPADGVITGHGRVNGRSVFAFFQDFTVRGGSLSEMHAHKICKILDLALKSGRPVVGFNDSGGVRIQEGIDALRGYGEIFFRNARASGVIPQIIDRNDYNHGRTDNQQEEDIFQEGKLPEGIRRSFKCMKTQKARHIGYLRE